MSIFSYSGSSYIIHSICLKYSKNFELKIARRDRVMRLKAIALMVCCFILLFFMGDAEAKNIKMAAVFQTPIEEPWDGAVHQGCIEASKELNVPYEFTEKVGAADFERVLREYAERGFDLIVGDAFLAGEEPVRRVAKDYPNIAFAFGSEYKPQEPNL